MLVDSSPQNKIRTSIPKDVSEIELLLSPTKELEVPQNVLVTITRKPACSMVVIE